jgi:hypothetical protein
MGRAGRGDAEQKAGCRDYSIICSENRRSQPSSAMSPMYFTMSMAHNLLSAFIESLNSCRFVLSYLISKCQKCIEKKTKSISEYFTFKIFYKLLTRKEKFL